MRALATLMVLVPLCARLWAQQPAPTNLQILKGMSRDDVFVKMQTFTEGLGVQCTFCHVGQDFARDDNARKQVARTMLVLAQELNAKFPDGKERITCYTCHHGERTPKTEPDAKPAQ